MVEGVEGVEVACKAVSVVALVHVLLLNQFWKRKQ